MSNDLPYHGTYRRYKYYGCRCVYCRRANADRVVRTREARFSETKDPNDPRHGTPGFYMNNGCRCADCKEARAEAERKYRARKSEA